MILTNWPTKDPREKLVAAFSFGPDLNAGETIESYSVACRSLDGGDTAPSALLNGDAELSGSDVLQPFHAGVAGTYYSLDCVATLSSGRVLVLAGLFKVDYPTLG